MILCNIQRNSISELDFSQKIDSVPCYSSAQSTGELSVCSSQPDFVKGALWSRSHCPALTRNYKQLTLPF